MLKTLQSILFLQLSFISSFVFCQDTTYYKQFDISINDSVEVYDVVLLSDSGACVSYVYVKTNYIFAQVCYSNYEKKIKESESWYENGRIKEKLMYTNEELDTFNTYWSNGELRRQEIYNSLNTINKKCWDSSGTEVEFFEYMIPPYCSNKTISSYIRRNFPSIPEYAVEECGYDHLKVSFVVKKDGSIADVKVLGIDCDWNKAIIKMIEGMPIWEPGKVENEPIDYNFILPIRYKVE